MRLPLNRLLRLLVLAGLALLALASVAGAATVTPPAHLALPSTQLWTLVIGALVPLVTYVLNHVGPWVSEPVKALVLLVCSAGAAALYTALSTNVIGLNMATLQLVLSGVLAALAAHHALWKPSGISARLGGGSNAPRRRLGWVNEPAPQGPQPPAAA